MKESFLQCVQSLLLSIGSKPEQFPNYIQFSTRQVFYTQMTVIVPSSRWLHSSKISTLVGKRSLCKHHTSVWGRDAELTAWLKRFFHQLWMAPGLPPLQADLYSAHSELILAPQTCEPPTTPPSWKCFSCTQSSIQTHTSSARTLLLGQLLCLEEETGKAGRKGSASLFVRTLTFRDADGDALGGYSSRPDSSVNALELRFQPETCN